MAELRAYGVPRTQVKVERTLPGVPVPFIGYIDFLWEQHAITFYMKSQLRLASGISSGHARQLALYLHGTNHTGRVAYITPAKIGVYVLDNAVEQIAAIINIANRLERFLNLSDDPQVLASLVVPDVDSFYFSDPVTRARARDVFGL